MFVNSGAIVEGSSACFCVGKNVSLYSGAVPVIVMVRSGCVFVWHLIDRSAFGLF